MGPFINDVTHKIRFSNLLPLSVAIFLLFGSVTQHHSLHKDLTLFTNDPKRDSAYWNPLSNKIYNVNDDRDIKCHFSIVRKAIKIISHAKSYVYIFTVQGCYFLLVLYKNNERVDSFNWKIMSLHALDA